MEEEGYWVDLAGFIVCLLLLPKIMKSVCLVVRRKLILFIIIFGFQDDKDCEKMIILKRYNESRYLDHKINKIFNIGCECFIYF